MSIRNTLLAAGALLAGLAASIYINVDETKDQMSGAGQTSSLALDKKQGQLQGSRLSQIKLPDLKGEPQSLSAWQGKLLLVNFWASWCPPCLSEIPLFSSLREKYAVEGFEVLGISIDSVQNVEKFRESIGIEYPLLDGEMDGMSLMRSLGNKLGALPYSVLFNRKGDVIHHKSGEFSHDELDKLIKDNLKSL